VSDPADPADPLAELVHELLRHTRLVHMMKSWMSGTVPPGLDGAAFGVLMALFKCGARRQGEIAEVSLLDPSTVSRYVAQLVRAGLVSRRADPADGRAVQLVLTPAGAALAEQVATRRRAMLGDLIADWSPADAGTLVGLLRRLNDDIEARRDGVDSAVRSVTG